VCVGNCNDPFVTYLKSFGYSPVRLPRADIRPLQLLARARRGDMVWISDITDGSCPHRRHHRPFRNSRYTSPRPTSRASAQAT
jgi:hypothetical protein